MVPTVARCTFGKAVLPQEKKERGVCGRGGQRIRTAGDGMRIGRCRCLADPATLTEKQAPEKKEKRTAKINTFEESVNNKMAVRSITYMPILHSLAKDVGQAALPGP